MGPEEQASRLKAIIDTAIDGIITINERGIIDTINPAAAVLFGYEPEEMVGHNVSMLMPEPDKSSHDLYIRNFLQTGQGKIIGIGREVQGMKKDGTLFPFRLAISQFMLDGNRPMFTGVIHDLTAQKQAEEQLLRYAKDLERSNRELQEFAYVSSHDLQEPLRKIRTFGSRIQEMETDNLSKKGKDYLGRMLSASLRMQHLIDDLLDFSRVSTKKELFQEVDLNKVIEDALADLEILIQDHNAQVIVKPLPVIQADQTQMRQLFQNLISNAVKFKQPDSVPEVTIESRIISASEGKGKDILEIKVIDNGIGFDEKYLDRIFQIFQRLDGRKFDGSGIGLAICRRIASKHGGDITAKSSPGKGSTFFVTLALDPLSPKSSNTPQYLSKP